MIFLIFKTISQINHFDSKELIAAQALEMLSQGAQVKENGLKSDEELNESNHFIEKLPSGK